MSQTIEAIYENGVFKPLRPVALPEGATVRFKPQSDDPVEEQIRQRLLVEGIDESDIELAFAKLRPLWSAFDSLTKEEDAALAEARLDQQHFFDRL